MHTDELHCFFVHHEPHLKSLEIESGSPWREAGKVDKLSDFTCSQDAAYDDDHYVNDGGGGDDDVYRRYLSFGMMVSGSSSQMSVIIYQITRSYISQDSHFDPRRHENLKSHASHYKPIYANK